MVVVEGNTTPFTHQSQSNREYDQSHNIVPIHQTNTKVRDSSRHQGKGSTEAEYERGFEVEVVKESSASGHGLTTKDSKGDGCDVSVTKMG